MSRYITRRDFIKTSAIAGAGLAGAYQFADGFALAAKPDELHSLCTHLVKEWGQQLLLMQVTDKWHTDNYGGIWCPADKAVHGRVGDTIYPFFYLAGITKDSRYIDAATLLFRWIERRVSQPDGSWLNEPQKGSWQGTTVFASIALGETLKNHSALMDPSFKNEVSARLKKAGDFIYNNFTISYGNINYPISASYGLSLLGEVLDVPKFKIKGRELAHQALQFFTPQNSFLKGEGDPYQASKKGCFAIDLGYNIEESLPSLTLFGLLNKDEEVLQTVARSLQTHMEFMLPDGGWDNSWGTRNYKWTYWGSRTSDGCQPAYALLANRDARFYKAAVLNTRLMQRDTVNGLLQGGPHFAAQGIPVCVHHTFCHIKGLTTVLEQASTQKATAASGQILPREKAYGIRAFNDIQTWLVAKGNFKATITGYDCDYKHTANGHATGGALTMLWHQKTGPILCASMNEYQLVEAGNMQTQTDPFAMPLTPRIELRTGDQCFMNISDQSATINTIEKGETLIIKTRSKLVDKDQHDPSTGAINCEVNYTFTTNKVLIHFKHDGIKISDNAQTIIPFIAKANEKLTMINHHQLNIKRELGGIVKITANQPLRQLPTTNGRVFNFVPGLEAIPFATDQNEIAIVIEVHTA